MDTVCVVLNESRVTVPIQFENVVSCSLSCLAKKVEFLDS